MIRLLLFYVWMLVLISSCTGLSYTSKIVNHQKICDSVFIVPVNIQIKETFSPRKTDWSVNPETNQKYAAYAKRHLRNKLAPYFKVAQLTDEEDYEDLYDKLKQAKDSLKKINVKRYILDFGNRNYHKEGYMFCLFSEWRNGQLRCEIETTVVVMDCKSREIVFFDNNFTWAKIGMRGSYMQDWNVFYRTVRRTMRPVVNSFSSNNRCFSEKISKDKIRFDLVGKVLNPEH